MLKRNNYIEDDISNCSVSYPSWSNNHSRNLIYEGYNDNVGYLNDEQNPSEVSELQVYHDDRWDYINNKLNLLIFIVLFQFFFTTFVILFAGDLRNWLKSNKTNSPQQYYSPQETTDADNNISKVFVLPVVDSTKLSQNLLVEFLNNQAKSQMLKVRFYNSDFRKEESIRHLIIPKLMTTERLTEDIRINFIESLKLKYNAASVSLLIVRNKYDMDLPSIAPTLLSFKDDYPIVSYISTCVWNVYNNAFEVNSNDKYLFLDFLQNMSYLK
ncbi:hypothetical protein ABK040_014591 [Willaertia magna]